MTIKIEIKTDSYNERRFGRPWIAKVDFSNDKKGEMFFGDWIGQHGDEGILELEANAGDIIATGQKDYRGKSDLFYYVLKEDGTLESMTKAAAYQWFKMRQNIKPKMSPVEKKVAEYKKKVALYDDTISGLKEEKKQARKDNDEKELDFLSNQIKRLSDVRQAIFQALKDFEELI